jgi:hypothetical protein
MPNNSSASSHSHHLSPAPRSLLLLLLLFTSALNNSTVSAFCGCIIAGLLQKFLKFVDSNFEREPLVAAGMLECGDVWFLLLLALVVPSLMIFDLNSDIVLGCSSCV